MKFSVFTVSVPDWTAEETLAALVAEGYDGVEWRVTDQQPSADGQPGFWQGNRCTWPLSSFVEDAPRLRAMTEAAGLAMPSVGTYCNCEDLGAVEQAMRGVKLLGAPMMRVSTPGYDGRDSWLRRRDRAVGQYRDVAALARQYGLRALIEIHMGNLLPSAGTAAAFCANFDPRDVGVIHDAGNMIYEGFENWRLGVEALGPYLAHVHLKNAGWEPAGTRPDGSTAWRCNALPLRAGAVDMAAVLRALRAVDYDGWLSFEDFSTQAPMAERVRDNLAFVRGLLAAGE
jgi:sugar phosphate isomerase/epimerase